MREQGDLGIMMSKVCAVILNYNDFENTINLTRNIYTYTCFDYIVVVDNCSTDDSFLFLSKHGNERIHVIKTDYNGGYGYGNKFGICYAKEYLQCRYALVANPDVSFDSNTIEQLLSIVAEDNNCAAVSCMQINDHVKNLQNAWRTPTGPLVYALSYLKVFGRFVSLNYPNYYWNAKDCVSVDCVQGAMLLLDIDKFLCCGGYDEKIFLYCEETSLGLRLKKHGYNTKLCTNISYHHYHSQSISKEASVLKNRYKIICRSKWQIIRDNWEISFIKKTLIDIIFGICILERTLIDMMRVRR